MLLACAISVVYSAGLAAWDEGRDMQDRYGEPFMLYRNHVRNWLPRWRPYVAGKARIYFAGECEKCSEMAAFVHSLRPIGLEILAAENHPERDLTRMTYACDDYEAEGLAALARSGPLAGTCESWLGVDRDVSAIARA